MGQGAAIVGRQLARKRRTRRMAAPAPSPRKGMGKAVAQHPVGKPQGGFKGWKGQSKGYDGKSGGKGLNWLDEPGWGYEMSSGTSDQAAFHIEVEKESAPEHGCRNLNPKPIRCDSRCSMLEVTDYDGEDFPSLTATTAGPQSKERADGNLKVRGKRPRTNGTQGAVRGRHRPGQEQQPGPPA